MNESVTFPGLNTPPNFPPARGDSGRPGDRGNSGDSTSSSGSRQLREWLRRTAAGLGAVQLLLDAGRSGEAGEALVSVRDDFQLLRYALDVEAAEPAAGRGANIHLGTAVHVRREDVRKN